MLFRESFFALSLGLSVCFAQTEFDGTQTRGDYVLSGPVSLSVLNATVGHWVDGGYSMSITGTSADAQITGDTAWWLLDENRSIGTVLTMTDVSMKNINKTGQTSNSAAAAVIGVDATLNIISKNYDVYIQNNTTTGYGGAFILEKKSTVAEGAKPVPVLNLTAEGGDIIFSGNGGTGPGKAIYVDQYGGALNFKASGDNSVVFNDVVYMRENTELSAGKSSLNIGDDSGAYSGTVSFLSDSENYLLDVTLYSGTLEFVLNSFTESNLKIDTLSYIDGDFNLVVSQEGSYSFALADSVNGVLDSSMFSVSEGYEMLDFNLDGNMLSFTVAAVPEPSFYAAIFGLFSILLAVRRRRA